ncbi:MAG: hypothetical protein M3280_06330 [Actinomycetota bacterium]|nr:hypothetical protein [Actinomycetota bacterium]
MISYVLYRLDPSLAADNRDDQAGRPARWVAAESHREAAARSILKPRAA